MIDWRKLTVITFHSTPTHTSMANSSADDRPRRHQADHERRDRRTATNDSARATARCRAACDDRRPPSSRRPTPPTAAARRVDGEPTTRDVPRTSWPYSTITAPLIVARAGVEDPQCDGQRAQQVVAPQPAEALGEFDLPRAAPGRPVRPRPPARRRGDGEDQPGRDRVTSRRRRRTARRTRRPGAARQRRPEEIVGQHLGRVQPAVGPSRSDVSTIEGMNVWAELSYSTSHVPRSNVATRRTRRRDHPCRRPGRCRRATAGRPGGRARRGPRPRWSQPARCWRRS